MREVLPKPLWKEGGRERESEEDRERWREGEIYELTE